MAMKKVAVKTAPAKKSAVKKSPVKTVIAASGKSGGDKPLDRSVLQTTQDSTVNQAKRAEEAARLNDQYIRS